MSRLSDEESVFEAKKNAETPFKDNGDGTVTDTTTGLMWQKDDDGERRNWGESWDYANLLTLAGYKDWRLPLSRELVSLWKHICMYNEDIGRRNKVRDTYFPSFKSDFYWTSSTDAFHDTEYVAEGRIYSHAQRSRGYFLVRCVRAGQ